jgi:hypothetical protein
MKAGRRGRLQLLLIVLLFGLPFLAAVVLRFGGWEPPHTRNHGDLLQPPLPMHGVQARRPDGSAWTFENVEREWSLLVRRPSDCGSACAAELALLPRVREALGRHAQKLHLFHLEEAGGGVATGSGWIGTPLRLDGTLPAPLAAPRDSRGVELWLVDPHGFLVMAYPAGYDPSGLRRDLARLVR